MAKYVRSYRSKPLKKAGKVANNAKSAAKPAKMANIVALSKQVKRLKTSMRREYELKKWDSSTIHNNTVGQVNGNISGVQIFDINLCQMASGLNANERVGEKTILKGIYLRMQLQQQISAAAKNMFYVELWRTSDFTATSTIINYLYDIDSISSIIDYNSTYNKDYVGKKSGYKQPYQLVARKRVVVKEDTVSNVSQFQNVKLFVKQNQELLYSGGANQSPTNVRYLCVIRAANGNSSSGTTSTLTGVPITAVSTGAQYWASFTAWYTDN